MRTSWESCGYKFSGLEHHVPNFQVALGKNIQKISHFWWIPSDGQQLSSCKPSPRSHPTHWKVGFFMEEPSNWSSFSTFATSQTGGDVKFQFFTPSDHRTISATFATTVRSDRRNHRDFSARSVDDALSIEKRHQDGASRGLTNRWMVCLEKTHGISKKGITWINVYVCLAYAYIYIYTCIHCIQYIYTIYIYYIYILYIYDIYILYIYIYDIYIYILYIYYIYIYYIYILYIYYVYIYTIYILYIYYIYTIYILYIYYIYTIYILYIYTIYIYYIYIYDHNFREIHAVNWGAGGPFFLGIEGILFGDFLIIERFEIHHWWRFGLMAIPVSAQRHHLSCLKPNLQGLRRTPTNLANPSNKNTTKGPMKNHEPWLFHGDSHSKQGKTTNPSTLQRLPRGNSPACRQLDGPGEDEIFAQPQQSGTPLEAWIHHSGQIIIIH